MKKIMAMLMATLLLLSLMAGCGSETAAPPTTADPPATTNTPTDPPEEKPKDAPAEEPSDKPTDVSDEAPSGNAESVELPRGFAEGSV